jgi:hypothetical protein
MRRSARPASTDGAGRLRDTALRRAAGLARGVLYLATQGARAITTRLACRRPEAALSRHDDSPPGTYPDKTGVSIWRDRRTGRCVASTKSLEAGFYNFEMALRVENKFNRLALLRSDVWHLGEAGFGSNVRNGRMFQTFFFDLRGKYEQVVPQREIPYRL